MGPCLISYQSWQVNCEVFGRVGAIRSDKEVTKTITENHWAEDLYLKGFIMCIR